MFLKRLVLMPLIVIVGACSDDGDGRSGSDLPPSSVPGVYSGVFPCADCPGIATTLWLRPDGRFFYRQHYPEVDDREAMTAYSLGRWTQGDGDSSIRLAGAGPARTFSRGEEHTLLMQTDSHLEHRLSRDPAAPDFLEAIRMTGMMHMQGNGASFTECLAGFVVPVASGREFSRFRHQYRSTAEQGRAVYVELQGRFDWAANGELQSLTIERFITVKDGGSC